MTALDRLCLPFVAVLVITGCYHYEPAQSSSPGTDIRARLTTEAAVRRSEGLDAPILEYDGVLVTSSSDSLIIDVLVARSSTAFQEVEIRDTVRLGRGEIQSLMARRISIMRSILVTVGAGVAAYAIIRGIDEVVGGTGDGDGRNPPPALRFPFFRWLGPGVVPTLPSGHR